ncbi:hypothetical protein ACEPAF_9641 [Sanghuangporus sanghuang]
MPFSQEELSEIVKEIRTDDNYFANSDSILNRCAFRQINDTQYDESAVDNLTEQELQLSIIGRVVRKSTFLQPEGAFRPSGVFPAKQDELLSLLNSTLRISLAPPKDVMDSRTAKDDWRRYQVTLSQLIKSTDQSEGTTSKYWSPYRKDKNKFMLRHLLISAKENSLEGKDNEQAKTDGSRGGIDFTSSQSGELDDDPIEDDDGSGLSDQQRNVEKHIDELTRIINWPASEDWHKVADRFDRTHYMNPLAAFNDEYELLAPKAYESKLLGAVVHARFTLSRFDIRGDHTFVCNIVELQVLRPPPGGVDVRKKRTLTDLVMDKKRKKRRIIW